MGTPDVVVIGLGIHGAAVIHELARRGLAVMGIDRFTPPHAQGSSHGRTRIIREAYFEDAQYVPLVQRAYELWLELEELTGAVLLRPTGGLMCGPPDGELVRGALLSAAEHGLDHEPLDASEVRRRFPGFSPRTEDVAVYEPRAGVLLAESCSRTLLALAQGWGAELRTGAAVIDWDVEGGDVVVRTESGVVRASRVVFAAGAWTNALLHRERGGDAVRLPLTVERQTSHWFQPGPAAPAYGADRYPIALWEYAPGGILYTLPDTGHGVKAGIHHNGAHVDPDTVNRTVSLEDELRVRALLDRYQRGAAHRSLDAAVCLYTNTPDHHFVLDLLPGRSAVIVLSACSGHGFKFAPALAELAADMVEGGDAPDAFALRRFGD